MKVKKIILQEKCFSLFIGKMRLDLDDESISWTIETWINEKIEITAEDLYRDLLWQWWKKYKPKANTNNVSSPIWFVKDRWDSL